MATSSLQQSFIKNLLSDVDESDLRYNRTYLAL
jgi:hypothetical protein